MCSETPVIRMRLSLLAEGKGSEMAFILGVPSAGTDSAPVAAEK